MYKSLMAALSIVTLASACHSPKMTSSSTNGASVNENKDGWTLLFDGKTTNGWHTYNRDTVSKNWKVIDGVLVMDPKAKTSNNMEDLVTNEEYENYELSLEWKIAEGGNSGIIFNVKEDPQYSNSYVTGPEMQILDNIKAEDNKKDNHLAGLLYDIYGTPDMSKPKPVGEWNVAKIIQKDGHLTFYLNDVKTLDVQQGSDEWKRMIDESKFKTWPAFATTPKGKIALQDHGYGVAFKNIKIRKL